jgi:putative transposase
VPHRRIRVADLRQRRTPMTLLPTRLAAALTAQRARRGLGERRIRRRRLRGIPAVLPQLPPQLPNLSLKPTYLLRLRHNQSGQLLIRRTRIPGHRTMINELTPRSTSHAAQRLTSYGEISAHLAEIYGAEVSKQTISTITDRVLEGMAAWQNRPLDPVYPVIFIDGVNVKIREGNVANRPIYVALAVTVEGHRDILGLWAGEHGDGEGAKYWMRVLAEIKNRGTQDCLIVVCDGLKGLPEAISAVWSQTIVQTCIVHLLRNSFRYASKKDWSAIAADLKPIYTAPSEQAALDAFAEFSEKWEKKYPAIIRLWTNAWAEFVPFLQFDQEIRTIICTTNAIESINARIRRAVNARGHFPTEAAALKCVYLAIMSLDPTGKGQRRWSNRWKAALNAFEITFDGRLSAVRNAS